MKHMTQERHHGGNVWQSDELIPLPLLDFSANINPLGLSPHAQVAMIQAIPELVHYPDPACQRLRSCLSNHTGVVIDQILVGNGAVELIFLLIKHCHPRRVLLPAPTFSEYALAAQAEGIPVEHRLWEGVEPCHKISSLAQAVQPADMIFLCNPNNPTGQLYTRDDIETLALRCETLGAFLVVDEAFLDFTDDHQSLHATPLLGRYPRLFILRSLTKFFALPGIRVGYLLGREKDLSAVALLRDPWSVNHLAQVAAVASLEDESYADQTRQWILSERNTLYQGLSIIPGLKPLPPSANFILVDCRQTSLTAAEIGFRLRGDGILIRDCQSYVGLDAYWFRVAVKDRAANTQLLAALRGHLDGPSLSRSPRGNS